MVAYCTSARYDDIFTFGSTETDFSSHTIDPLREILLQFDSFSSELTVSCRAPGELLGHFSRVNTFCQHGWLQGVQHGTDQTLPVYKGNGIIHTAAEEQRTPINTAVMYLLEFARMLTLKNIYVCLGFHSYSVCVSGISNKMREWLTNQRQEKWHDMY